MKKLFADTGYWIALLNPKDDLYPKTRQLTTTLKSRPIVTSQMVFTELLNAFSGREVTIEKKQLNLLNIPSQIQK